MPEGRTRRAWWAWIAVAVGVAAVAALWVYGLFVYANHDRTEFIDDPAVVAKVSIACTQLADELASMRRDGLRPDRAAESAAVRAMVAAIRTLGEETINGDLPTEDWLDDWEALAESHAGARPVPVDGHGKSIVERMNTLATDSGVPQCQVPETLSGS